MARRRAKKREPENDLDDLNLDDFDSEGPVVEGPHEPEPETTAEAKPAPKKAATALGPHAPQDFEVQLAKAVAQNSIEIKRGAKGVYTWAIKLYGDEGGMTDLVEEAKRLDGLLVEGFVHE